VNTLISRNDLSCSSASMEIAQIEQSFQLRREHQVRKRDVLTRHE